MQAFLHVDVIGLHVADRHYDLLGPNGEIILPQVWETMVEPGWMVTMHMWPLPDPPTTITPPPMRQNTSTPRATTSTNTTPQANGSRPRRKEAPKPAAGMSAWFAGAPTTKSSKKA